MRAFHSILVTASSLLAGGALLLSSAGAQTSVATDPVGFTAISLPANSDTLISIPFTQPPVFTGAIQSVTGSTITLAASPGWTSNQFVYVAGSQSNTYYAIIGPNTNALTGTITATNGNTAVTGSGTAFLSQVAVNDELLINGLAYNVATVSSDTTITLARAYAGTSGAGLTISSDRSPQEGSYYTVTGNGTNTLTVNLNGDSLNSVAVNTSVSLIPYWTIGTAFPASAAGTSFTASTSAKALGTQILLPDMVSHGVNLSATAIFYYLNGAWQRVGNSDPNVVPNDTILPPASYLTVRNASTSTTFTPMGGVYMNRLSIPLDTQASAPQDNAVSIARPAAVTLNDSGLISSGAFTPGTGPKQLGDLLLMYNNAATGINKSASAIYYNLGGIWHLSAAPDPAADYGSTLIPYGVGFTIRKLATGNGATSFWQNTRNY